MILTVLACRPPTDGAPAGHTGDRDAAWTDTASWTRYVTHTYALDAAFTDGGELCVFAAEMTTRATGSSRRSGYGPTPFTGYWIPLDQSVPLPESRPPLPDAIGLQAVVHGPDDLCFVAAERGSLEGSVLYAVMRDGAPDPRFGAVDLPEGHTVTALTRDGDVGLWVSGFDMEGGWVRRYDRDGVSDPRVRLPIVPLVLRAVADGFVVASDDVHGELWRTDRRGRARMDWGDQGRVVVPGDPGVSGVDIDLDPEGNALFVQENWDGDVREYMLRTVGADGVIGPVTPLPPEVYHALWDGADQLWIEADRVTRRLADGTPDSSFGDGGAVALPSEDGGRAFYRGTTGHAALFASWWKPSRGWTTLRITDTPGP